MDRGEYLTAFDLATEAIGVYPDNITLQYEMILALARAGATGQALLTLESSRLEQRAGTVTVAFREDVQALRARLAKDRALDTTGPERQERARIAAERYEAIYQNLQRPYTCINAATMWLVAGDEPRSEGLARAAVELCGQRDQVTPDAPYWRTATEAEAALLLADYASAHASLERAATHAHGQLASVAATRKQLRLICEAKGIDPEVLEALPVPGIICFSGHMIAPPGQPGPFPSEGEAAVGREIRDYVEEQHVGFGYGSLASGADILFAEALLAIGAELHVVLPFAEEEFMRVSVEPGGPGWTDRFERCQRQAASVIHATRGEYLGDDSLFAYATCLAMGQALIRADFLAAPVTQVVAWDRTPSENDAGTAVDVEVWRATGRPTHVIGVPSSVVGHTDRGRPPTGTPRTVRAMLFADIKGFSGLKESQIPAFFTSLMGPLGATLDRFGPAVLYRNSWGDGLYVVFRDVRAAALCALALLETMRQVDYEKAGLPSTLGLRIGAHAGPVFQAQDPVRKEATFYGTEVTRTARIEPRTPEGEVYVTDSFAALLALDNDHTLSCQYVGHIPTDKDYGVFPMFVLKQRT